MGGGADVGGGEVGVSLPDEAAVRSAAIVGLRRRSDRHGGPQQCIRKRLLEVRPADEAVAVAVHRKKYLLQHIDFIVRHANLHAADAPRDDVLRHNARPLGVAFNKFNKIQKTIAVLISRLKNTQQIGLVAHVALLTERLEHYGANHVGVDPPVAVVVEGDKAVAQHIHIVIT